MSNLSVGRIGVMPGRGGNFSGGKPKQTKSTLIKLIKFIGKDKFLLVLVFASTLTITGCALYAAYAIKPLIGMIEMTIAGTWTVAYFFARLQTFLISLGLVYSVQVALTLMQSQLMVRVSQRTVYRLRKVLYQHLLKIPVRYHDQHTHGELMSRFTSDIELISDTITNSVSSIVSSTLMLAGTTLMLIYLSYLLAIILLVALPIFGLLINRIVSISRKHFRSQQQAIGKLNGFIEENLEGQQITNLYRHQNQSMKTFNFLNEDYRHHAFRAQSWSGLMIPLVMNLNSVNYAIVAASGAYLAITTGLSVGTLGAFVNSTRQFSRPLNEIATQYTTIQAGLAAAERVFEVLEEPEEALPLNPSSVTTLQGAVRFDDVSFGYVEGKTILNHVSFYAKPGQKIAIVGSTGAGKTTITNLITLFYPDYTGSITIDGIEIRHLNQDFLRRSMALVLQDTHLFSGSILDNIRYGNPLASDEECIEAAKTAYAHPFIMRLNQNYQTQISYDGNELSQGQRQLLTIARATLSNPKILILDEATSSIDTRTERLIEKGMDQLTAGRTTFVIAHRLSTVRHANAILVLENGVIIERGDHDDLMKANGRYASLVKGQSELT